MRRIEIQEFHTDDSAIAIDSTVLWASAAPVNPAAGTYATYRVAPDTAITDTILIGSRTFQMAHRGRGMCFTSANGLRILPQYNPASVLADIRVVTSLRDTSVTPNRIDTSRAYGAVLMVGDTMHIGKTSSFGVTTNGNLLPSGGDAGNNRFHLVRANVNGFAPDSIHQYTTASGLPGEFVVSLDVQYRPSGPPVVWAGTRPVFSTQATGVAYLDSLPGDTARLWHDADMSALTAWNFGFSGDSVYIASDSGLYFAPTPTSSFQPVAIRSSNAEILIPAGVQANGVEVIDGRLWVATDEGFASQILGDPYFDVHRVLSNEGAPFAFPIPYSPFDQGSDGKLKFNYRVPTGATSASISIYDFAMNLVREVNSNVARQPGELVSGRESDKWDGQNGEGRYVAPGMYYFRVKFSNGETQWGKLAVIP